jgi:hypothetical protein
MTSGYVVVPAVAEQGVLPPGAKYINSEEKKLFIKKNFTSKFLPL